MVGSVLNVEIVILLYSLSAIGVMPLLLWSQRKQHLTTQGLKFAHTVMVLASMVPQMMVVLPAIFVMVLANIHPLRKRCMQ